MHGRRRTKDRSAGQARVAAENLRRPDQARGDSVDEDGRRSAVGTECDAGVSGETRRDDAPAAMLLVSTLKCDPVFGGCRLSRLRFTRRLSRSPKAAGAAK